MTTTSPAIKPENRPAPAKKSIKDFLSSSAFSEQVAKALPRHITPERFMRVALTAVNKTPKLFDCSQESLFAALLTCSQLGIEPDGRRAHLIPYGRDCQLIIDYKGLIELAKRSGEVVSWASEVVKENDEFSWDNGVVTHKIDFRKPRGAAQCYYSRVTLKDGSLDFDVMTIEEVQAVRKRSRAGGNGPWVSDFDEMAKKTVIRRHSKRLTLSPEFRDAVEADDDAIDIEAKPAVRKYLSEMIETAPDEQVTTDQAAHVFTREDAEKEITNYILETGVSEKALLREVTEAKLVQNPDGLNLLELTTDALSAIAAYVKAKPSSTTNGGE